MGVFSQIPKDSSKEAVLRVLPEKELLAVLKQYGPRAGLPMEAVLQRAAQMGGGGGGGGKAQKEGLLELALTLDLSAADLRKLRDVEQARGAQVKTVNALLAARADPNVLTHSGHSALFVACQRGAAEAARALFAAGADPSIR